VFSRTGLTKIIIPDGVTTIGEDAFHNCESLKSVTIGIGVTKIDKNAFNGCVKLTDISVNMNNPYYSSEDGVLFNKDKTKLVLFPYGKTGSYTIPDGVTAIGNKAFEHCKELTEITLPDSMKTIGKEAFSGCNGLKIISIPESVVAIGDYAFGGGLTSIAIPVRVTKMENAAFYRCSDLTSISVDTNNPDFSSEGGVLFNKDKTILIKCPQRKTGSYIVPDNVIKIDSSAFSGCVDLTDITIPGSVIDIGQNAFYNCVSLETINIPDGITTIKEDTFESCVSLKNITIPDSVTRIGFCAFADCESLTNITIPDNVTSIDYQAFTACKSLTIAVYKNKTYGFLESDCDLPREFYDAVNGEGKHSE
jgi:hypothetical protein